MTAMEKSKKRLSVPVTVLICGFTMCALLYILAEALPGFADSYTDNVFVYLNLPLCTLNSLLPFSVGEILIILGLLIITAGPVALIAYCIIRRHNRKKVKSALKFSALFLAFVVLFIALTETLNCFIQYRCSTFSDRYFTNSPSEGYTAEQLSKLCESLVNDANKLSQEVPRDSDGQVLIPDDAGEKAGKYMQKLGEKYSRLSGPYTDPKYIICSRFMSKSNLQGIYFPFTMEANINRDMMPARKPATMCHELAHTKGFILEDEAGFIAYLACIGSEDPLFMYSGTLSAMTYAVNQLYAAGNDEETFRISGMISPLVRADNKFLSEEYKKSLEEEKVLKKETVSRASEKALDANLKINGIPDGKQSYSRIVNLLLEYYYYQR